VLPHEVANACIRCFGATLLDQTAFWGRIQEDPCLDFMCESKLTETYDVHRTRDGQIELAWISGTGYSGSADEPEDTGGWALDVMKVGILSCRKYSN